MSLNYYCRIELILKRASDGGAYGGFRVSRLFVEFQHFGSVDRYFDREDQFLLEGRSNRRVDVVRGESCAFLFATL